MDSQAFRAFNLWWQLSAIHCLPLAQPSYSKISQSEREREMEILLYQNMCMTTIQRNIIVTMFDVNKVISRPQIRKVFRSGCHEGCTGWMANLMTVTSSLTPPQKVVLQLSSPIPNCNMYFQLNQIRFQSWSHNFPPNHKDCPSFPNSPHKLFPSYRS